MIEQTKLYYCNKCQVVQVNQWVDIVVEYLQQKYKIQDFNLKAAVNFRMSINKENQSRASRVTKQSLPDYNGQNLQEYMQILYTHQKQWEKQGKYMEADLAKKRLAKMRVQLDKQKRQQILYKQENEKSEVEMAHVEQVSEFNKYWDEKMLEYQAEAEKLEQETVNRHQAQMEQFEKQIEQSISYKQKESSEAINLKRIEQNLARQENYVEAHRVQKQLQELERTEYEKWMVIRNNKIRNLLNQLKTKQQNQASALRQRIEQGFEEQKKTRHSEQQKLIQKYTNFMKDLQNHHTQQLIRFQKSVKMQSTATFSKAMSMSRALQSVQSKN